MTPTDLESSGFCKLVDVLSVDQVDTLRTRLRYYVAHPERFAHDMEFKYEDRESAQVRKLRRLAWVDPKPWSSLWTNDVVRALLLQLYPGNLRILSVDAFLKPARVGSATPFHQDQAMWTQSRPQAISCWFALDRADEENGCLVFCRRSHHMGLLPHQSLSPRDHPSIPRELLSGLDMVPVPLGPGDAVVWDRYLIHGSARNTSDRPRRAVVMVVAPGADKGREDESLIVWPRPIPVIPTTTQPSSETSSSHNFEFRGLG
jgi:phytanoyl-CoA hydroxylase